MSVPAPRPAAHGQALHLSRESLLRICRFVTGQLGIKMSEAKLPMLQSRLQRRVHALRLSSLEDYQRYLFESPHADAELVHFIDAVTTNKTDFFREPSHFEHLAHVVLPAADPGGATWRFRAWCAGCSTGEEAYTLAIALHEFAAHRPGFDYSIFATDISQRVLAHAECAIYDEARLAPVAPALVKKYFLRSRDPQQRQARVVPELRERLTFRRLNFMADDYAVREVFDAVFFRNVMIYFDPPTQTAVVTKIARHLRPGGHFYTGHAESLANLAVPLTTVGASVYRRN